jgi:uncharacterized membrane protein
MVLLVALHIVGAIVWVGGMFFAYMALRPASGELEPAVRLPLWGRVFSRFFPWVWMSIAALLVSGYGMVFHYLGGFRGVGLHVHLMQGTGLVMMLLYFHLFFVPWRRFQAALAGADLPSGARHLNQIRLIVGVNLILGLITVILGATGRWWG